MSKLERIQVTAADGGQPSVVRLGGEGGDPVLLVPGLFSNHAFWCGSRGRPGMAEHLRERGFDVWLADVRGHGPEDRMRGGTSADDYILQDIPALVAHVYEEAGPLHAVGHSFGGLYLAGALAAQRVKHQRLRSLVLVGSQISMGQAALRLPLVGALVQGLARRVPVVPGRRLGLGGVDAPGTALAQMIAWKRGDSWRSGEGLDYGAGLGSIELPTLAIYSDGDRGDPVEGCRRFARRLGGPVEHLHLGRARGHREDYSHPGMIRSRGAREEVWPRIVGFLEQTGD